MSRSMMMIAHDNSSAQAPFFNPSRYSQRSKAASSACSASASCASTCCDAIVRLPEEIGIGNLILQRLQFGLESLQLLRQLFQLALQVIA